MRADHRAALLLVGVVALALSRCLAQPAPVVEALPETASANDDDAMTSPEMWP